MQAEEKAATHSPTTARWSGPLISYSRTIRTGQWAWRTTESETLPINALLKDPRPRLPKTMSPAPSSSASPTISASGLPSLACISAISPPLCPTRCICSSSFVLACFLGQVGGRGEGQFRLLRAVGGQEDLGRKDAHRFSRLLIRCAHT